jgi:hypothetical protein
MKRSKEGKASVGDGRRVSTGGGSDGELFRSFFQGFLTRIERWSYISLILTSLDVLEDKKCSRSMVASYAGMIPNPLLLSWQRESGYGEAGLSQEDRAVYKYLTEG